MRAGWRVGSAVRDAARASTTCGRVGGRREKRGGVERRMKEKRKKKKKQHPQAAVGKNVRRSNVFFFSSSSRLIYSHLLCRKHHRRVRVWPDAALRGQGVDVEGLARHQVGHIGRCFGGGRV